MTVFRTGETAASDATDARWSGLMASAQGGDSQAYTVLLMECRPLLRRICQARLRDSAEVEDAIQDIMLTLHLIRHTYDPSRPFKPWVIAIATRRAIDRGRKRASRARHEAAFAAETGALPAAQASAADFLADARLRHALDALPAAQRTALGLTKLEELTLTEASQRSGMTTGALKVAVYRGLRTLRQRFKGGW